MEGGYNYQTKTLHSTLFFDCVNDGRKTCMVGGKMSNGIDYIASTEGMTYPYTGKSKRLNDRGG